MGKYQPLRKHLGRSKAGEVRLSFEEVEKILGFRLPNSAREYPAWWSNNAVGHSHSRAWIEEGWASQEVDIARERVTFVRKDEAGERPSAPRDIFGILKGTVRVIGPKPITDPTGEIWNAELGKF